MSKRPSLAYAGTIRDALTAAALHAGAFTIGHIAERLNDRTESDDSRGALLLPLLSQIGAARRLPTDEATRGFLAVDWLIRECLPTWMRLSSKGVAIAEELRALPPIVDYNTLFASVPVRARAHAAQLNDHYDFAPAYFYCAGDAGTYASDDAWAVCQAYASGSAFACAYMAGDDYVFTQGSGFAQATAIDATAADCSTIFVAANIAAAAAAAAAASAEPDAEAAEAAAFANGTRADTYTAAAAEALRPTKDAVGASMAALLSRMCAVGRDW